MRLKITPTPSNTPSNTPTNTPSNTSCPTSTPTPTPTITPTITSTNTPTITPTITPTSLCFETGNGFDSITDDVLIESNDKMLVVGNYTNYSGQSANRIIYLNNDGSIDNTYNFGTGFNGRVRSIGKQSNGKYILGGNSTMTQYSGITIATAICRLNTDFTLDTSFNITNGLNFGSAINKLIVLPNDKILIAGSFTSYSGITANDIARLNSDGTLDNTFNAGTGAVNGTILDFGVQSDGKIIVVGNFTDFNGNTVGRVARLNSDGSFDNTFSGGTGSPNQVLNVFITSDDKILLPINSSWNGTDVNLPLKLNSNGTLDTTFNPPTLTGTTSCSLYQYPDGKVLVGARYRLNSNGSLDNTYVYTDIPAIQTNFEFTSTGKIIVLGSFTSIDGYVANRIGMVGQNGRLIDCTFSTPTPTPTLTRTPTVTPTNTQTPTPSSSPSIATEYLLQEDGSFILQEDNGQIIIE